MKANISIILCVKDAEKHICKCISSLLDQTIADFQIVIIDDASSDNSARIIKTFSDKRIRYFKNQKNLGLAKSRNKGLRLSKGEYIFFTDSDCVVSKNWIEHGLKFLEDRKYVGVEGIIYYVSKEYKPTYSDHVCKNEYGGHFMTGNVAYRASVIQGVGGFDEKYNYLEDRDLALRILKRGKIGFSPNMIVYVQQQTLTPKEVVMSSRYAKNRVFLFKRFGDRKSMLWRIVEPLNLAKVLYPPATFVSLFSKKFKTQDDYKLLPYKYVQAIFERLQIWKTCAKERVFLI